MLEETILHAFDKPEVCETCSKCFSSSVTLQVHQNTVHQENRDRPFSCCTCQKSFYNIQTLQQHEKCHFNTEDYQCHICNKLFKTYNYFKNHYNAVHLREKSFDCKICSKTFSRKAELKNHVRVHTDERPFKCRICCKGFKQLSNLQTHIRTTHQGEKRYQCLECPKRFTRQRLLDYHINAKHTNEKPLKCTYCVKTFLYPQLYKKHMLHCKSKPNSEYYVLEQPEGEELLVQRIGTNYYVINSDPNNVPLNVEQPTIAQAVQSDDHKVACELPDQHQKLTENLEERNNIQQSENNFYPQADEAVSENCSNSFSMLGPNTSTQEVVMPDQTENTDEVFEVIYNGEDGFFYTCDCNKTTTCDSISFQELLEIAPLRNDNNLSN